MWSEHDLTRLNITVHSLYTHLWVAETSTAKMLSWTPTTIITYSLDVLTWLQTATKSSSSSEDDEPPNYISHK